MSTPIVVAGAACAIIYRDAEMLFAGLGFAVLAVISLPLTLAFTLAVWSIPSHVIRGGAWLLRLLHGRKGE